MPLIYDIRQNPIRETFQIRDVHKSQAIRYVQIQIPLITLEHVKIDRRYLSRYFLNLTGLNRKVVSSKMLLGVLIYAVCGFFDS
jgi:hypothetical protein